MFESQNGQTNGGTHEQRLQFQPITLYYRILPQSPYDFFASEFPYDFLDIADDHGLRCTCMCLQFIRPISCSGFSRHSVTKTYGDRKEIVGSPQYLKSYRAHVMFLRPHDFNSIVRTSCDNRAIAVRRPYDHLRLHVPYDFCPKIIMKIVR